MAKDKRHCSGKAKQQTVRASEPPKHLLLWLQRAQHPLQVQGSMPTDS
jgi:hypothetical protein